MFKNEKEQAQHYQQVRDAISMLSTKSPKYVKEAKKRAEKYSKDNKIECVICVDGTPLDILHVFPPLNPDPTDKLIDTDWHVKCPKCNHEDLFTTHFSENHAEFKEMKKQGEQQRKNQQRKKRRRRRRR